MFWMIVTLSILGATLLIWGVSNWIKSAEESALHEARKKESRRQMRNTDRAAAAKADAAKPPKVIETMHPDAARPPSGRRQPLILLVEDSQTMMLTLRKILERWDYQVQTATDGKKAWSSLQGRKPDLVISDIDMPVMNGLELVELMRTDIAMVDIPVILITASPFYHAAASQSAGIEGLLAKPFEDRVLLDQIKYVLQE